MFLEPKNILDVTTREEFRQWLEENHDKKSECWTVAKKGKHKPKNQLWYLDAVEEVLCFGWIDTTHKRINGVDMQRFTPRTKRSQWSELNKERCRRLERLGLMTNAGRKELPDMSEDSFKIDKDIQAAFNDHPQAWQNFQSFPKLYQRVRIDSIQRDKKKDRAVFDKRLAKLIDQSEQGKMFGEWNDYGRLL
ncbi:YdeI/OmpD-associated family protein [Limosilactobacillus caviae]|uniref:YdeI/OmpD-associated family protein n=1 Tax=Limosilactobacillus caviae TaxID=1769424 RepID=UPI003D2081A6